MAAPPRLKGSRFTVGGALRRACALGDDVLAPWMGCSVALWVVGMWASERIGRSLPAVAHDALRLRRREVEPTLDDVMMRTVIRLGRPGRRPILRSVLFSKLQWREAGDFSEASCEVGLVVEAGVEGDVADGVVGGGEKTLGFLEP